MNARPRATKKSARTPESGEGGAPANTERLQKVLAAAGIASRRDCEELILEGRVEVDRQVVDQLGAKVDPVQQEIRVDGVALPKPKRRYYVLNKPAGVVSTNHDPAGRVRVVDLIKSDERLFTVGRLDRTSEGLIIVTNDGELANRLTHPRYGVSKEYAVRVAGSPTPETLNKLRRGVHLAEGPARAESIRVRRRHKQSTDLEIVLNEGRNREIRRLLARVGHKVLKLRRLSMGTLRLGNLPVGAYRQLTTAEVRSLLNCVDRGKRDRAKSPHSKSPHSKSPNSKSPRSKSPQSRDSRSRKPAKRSDQRPPAKKRDRTPTVDSRGPQGAVLAYDETDTPAAGGDPKRPARKKTKSKPPKAGREPGKKSGGGKPAKKSGGKSSRPKKSRRKGSR